MSGFWQLGPKTPRQSFWLATAVSAVLGVLVLPALANATGVDSGFGGGVHDGYIEIARNLARGNGFVFEPGGDPVGHRPPVYPMLLAPVTLLPTSLVRVVLTGFQALLIGLTAALTFRLASRLFNHEVARVAVLVFLANPWIYWVVRNPMTPILQMFLYAWFFDVLLVGTGWSARATGKTSDEHPSGFWIASLKLGLLGGALILTHGAMLLTVVFLVAIGFGTAIGTRQRARASVFAVAGVIVVLCVAPWTYRNWVTFHRLIPVATNAGYAYFLGNAHWGLGDAPGGPWPGDKERALALAGVSLEVREAEHFFGIRDVELDVSLNSKMKEDVLDNPGRLAIKMILNGLEYYFPVAHPLFSRVESGLPVPIWGHAGKIVRSVYYVGLWTLALLGALWWRRRHGILAPALLLLAIVAFAGPFLPFLAFCAHNHYAFGTLSFLSIASAVGVFAIVEQLQSDRSKGRPGEPA